MLLKKAYELSVLCGMKISVFGTDFEKNCFSYSNDERLKQKASVLLSECPSRINYNEFEDEDVNFSPPDL